MPKPRRLPLRFETLEDRVTPTGGLDPTFGDGDGLLEIEHRLSMMGNPSVAVQSDGKILFHTFDDRVGETDGLVIRVNPDGSLDSTFGIDGKVALTYLWHRYIQVASDGRIYVSGMTQDRHVSVQRLNTDGSIDTTFGTDGLVLADFTPDEPLVTEGDSDPDDTIGGMTILPDGRLVVVGRVWGREVFGMGAVRLMPNGELDVTFDHDGRATYLVPVNPGIAAASDEDVAVLPDGDLVLVGHMPAWIAGSSPESFVMDFNRGIALTVVRFNQDGSLDTAFAGDGVWISGENGSPNLAHGPAELVVQPDGRVVLVGQENKFDGKVVLVRLNADGSLDPTFGTDGQMEFLTGGTWFGDLTQLPDGRLVVAASPEGVGKITLGILNPDGTPNDYFGNGSWRAEIKYPDRIGGRVSGLAATEDGRIVLVGSLHIQTILAAAVLVERSDALPLGGDSNPGSGDPNPPIVIADPPPSPPNPPDDDTDPGTIDPWTDQNPIFIFDPPPPTGDQSDGGWGITADVITDSVTSSAPGAPPEVVVTDGRTGTEVRFAPFESTFTGGVFVTTADLDGDGWAELIVTPRDGGGPRVRVFSVAADGTIQSRADFFGLDDPAFRGGVNATATDVTGDGVADLVVAAGAGGGPRVAVWDGQQLFAESPICVADFFAFEESLRSGVTLAAGDLNQDGRADLAFGSGPGSGPRVRVIDGAMLLANGSFASLDEIAETTQLANFFADDAGERSGVRLATRDMDNDGEADLITGIGEGDASRVCVYLTPNLLANADPVADQELDSFEAVLADGVFVG